MRGFRKLFKTNLASMAVCLLLLVASSASADLIQFNLVYPNTALESYSAPYAHVTITTDGGVNASVRVDAYAGYTLGSEGVFALNTYGTAIATNLSPDSTLSFIGSGNVSDFGSFNVVLKNFDGWSHSVTTLAFTLVRTDGDVWGNAADILQGNASDYIAAGHIFVADNGRAIVTGYAAQKIQGTSVPLPSALFLLGPGLAGAIVLRRKIKQ
jgi:hypothetical protein